jgi:hypothetical protein
MSKPTNSAARNQMSEFERQCYDWGWADSEERIIKLLESRKQHEALASIDQSAYRMNLMLDLTIALIKGKK